MIATRRSVLKLAAFASSAAALSGAVRAEGGKTASDAAVAPAAALPFAQQTPMHIGAAALRVRDMAAMRKYYTELLGFGTIREDQGEVVLGVDGVALLHLIHKPNAAIEGDRAAGLFHTAFLMPTREDFARWLVHADRNKFEFTGFADHNVSEASYLDDPEGNGVEVYSDRPPSGWRWSNGAVTMGTARLDIDSILKLTDTSRDQYSAPPRYLRIGHVHLRVGDVDRGRAFYEKLVGLNFTKGISTTAAFLSSGRYHHHVAVNTWSSQGAGPRDPEQTGLAWFSLLADDTLLADRRKRFAASGTATDPIGNGIEVADPWGTRVRIVTSSG